MDGAIHTLKIFGDDYEMPDGPCVRDYVHVSDLCEAQMKALNYLLKGGNSDVIDLGNGTGFSVLQVIESTRKVIHKDIKYSVVQRRLGDPAILVASSEKPKRILGWTPNYVELEDIVETAWQWHR